MHPDSSMLDYLLSRLTTTEIECWEWQGSRIPGGYGIVQRRPAAGKYVHRLMWEYTYGPIPAGLFVCHHCDNPACANPQHLFLGTQFDNMRDMMAKGRDGRSTHPERFTHLHGRVALRPCILTEAQACELARAYYHGVSKPTLATIYGVGHATVNGILAGRRWGWATGLGPSPLARAASVDAPAAP